MFLVRVRHQFDAVHLQAADAALQCDAQHGFVMDARNVDVVNIVTILGYLVEVDYVNSE